MDMDPVYQKKLDNDLTRAAERNNIPYIKTLIEAGADVNTKDIYGNTPLHWTVLSGNSGCIELFVKAGTDINTRNINGWTALHFAVYRNMIDSVELLIKEGADINIQDDDYSTPLHYAALNGNIDCMELLLRSGADMSIVNSHGKTAVDILRKEYPDRYSEHMDNLQDLFLAVRDIKTNDMKQPADTGFEFDL